MAVNPTGTLYDPTKAPGLVTAGGPVSTLAVQPTSLPEGQIGNSAPNQPAVINPVADYNPALGDTGKTTSQTYNPNEYAVPNEGLVQTQIDNISKSGSPLMQQAERIGLEKAAARGMVNSSIGVTAAQDSVLSAALPIAQQDASAINTAAQRSTDARNDAAKFGADATNQAANLNAQLENSMNTTNANALNTQLSTKAQAENVRMLALIDNNTKMELGTLDVQSRQLLQTNANVANMFQETVKNIAGISVNETLTQSAKDQAVRSQINLLKEGLAAAAKVATTIPSAIGELSLGNYFNQF